MSGSAEGLGGLSVKMPVREGVKIHHSYKTHSTKNDFHGDRSLTRRRKHLEPLPKMEMAALSSVE